MLAVYEKDPTEINVVKLFKIMNYSMKIMLCHPNIKRNLQWACRLAIMYGICLFTFSILVYSIIFHDLKNKDLAQACSNCILCIIFCVVTVDYFVLLGHRTIFKEMIEKMNKDYYEARNFSREEFDVILTYVKRGQKVEKFWLITTAVIASVFPLKSIILMIYYYIMGEFKLVHLYDFTYPAPIEEVKNDLPIFLVLYAVLVFYDLYAMMMFIGFEPFGPILMLHVCGQMRLADIRIRRIFKESLSSEEKIRRLKDIVIFSDNMYRFVEKINSSFRLLYEITLKSTIAILPITLYQVLESLNHGEIKIEFISMIVAEITHSSIPCYYSDLLMDSSEKLRLAVYSCGWEMDTDRKCRKFILFMLLRTSKPVAIRTVFRELSLVALTDVYHQSYAIFNVLLAAWR